MPLLYLFEPWKAPKSVQEATGCVVGRDYPPPMVDHKQASNMCMAKMDKIKRQCQGQSVNINGWLNELNYLFVTYIHMCFSTLSKTNHFPFPLSMNARIIYYEDWYMIKFLNKNVINSAKWIFLALG
jgi:hypothetical protein